MFKVFYEVNEQGQITGRVVGVEVIAFSKFRYWDEVPDLPVLWRLEGGRIFLSRWRTND